MSFVFLALAFALPAHAGAVASNFKPERKQGANTYNAQSAIDGDPATCWQLPGESQNSGEWIILDVPKSTLDKIGMTIGWAASDDTFMDYARVKSVKIEVMAYDDNNELKPAGQGTATFEDKAGFQIVDIDDIQIGQDMFGGKVKLTVTDVYPGRDYPNLAISEIVLQLAEMDASPVVENPSAEDAGHTIDMLTDDNDKTFWSAPAEGASLELKVAGFSVSRVGLVPVGKEYARPKKVRITAHSRTHEIELPDSSPAWIEIPSVVGFTGSGYQGSEFEALGIEILEVYPGTKYPSTLALKDLQAKATAFEGF